MRNLTLLIFVILVVGIVNKTEAQMTSDAPYDTIFFEPDSLENKFHYSTGSLVFDGEIRLRGTANELALVLDTFRGRLNLSFLEVKGEVGIWYCELNGITLPHKADQVIVVASINKGNIIGSRTFISDPNKDEDNLNNSPTSQKSRDHFLYDSIKRLDILTTDDLNTTAAVSNQMNGDIVLSNVFVKDGLTIDGYLSGMLDLSYFKLGKDAEGDLQDLHSARPSKKILLNLYKAPIEQLRLTWGQYELDWRSDSSFENKCSVYEALLANFRKHGQQESIDAVDKEYQAVKKAHILQLWNILNWAWWNYGYWPALPILWTIVLLLLWTIVNLATYAKMQHEVYAIEGLKNQIPHPSKRNAKNFYLCFIYTANIFFAISLKLDTLRFNNRGLLAKFMAIYLTGIFCLFFIANFLLKAS